MNIILFLLQLLIKLSFVLTLGYCFPEACFGVGVLSSVARPKSGKCCSKIWCVSTSCGGVMFLSLPPVPL